ncbi:MAG: hypothetical protein ABGX16_07525 [Pirellulales bacterium]
MDRWDLLLIGIAGYVAVMALVRLMAGRRNKVIEQFHQDAKRQAATQANKKSKTNDKQADQDVA